MRFNNFTEAFASTFSWILLFLVMITPPFVYIFTSMNFNNLHYSTYQDKIGALYEELNLSEFMKSLFHFFFVVRRLILVLTIVFA